MLNLLSLLRRGVDREPVALVTIGVAAALTAYKIFIEKMPVAELLTAEYLDYVLLTAGALVSRALVWSRKGVEAELVAVAVNRYQDEDEAS